MIAFTVVGSVADTWMSGRQVRPRARLSLPTGSPRRARGRRICPRAKPHPSKMFYQGARVPYSEFGINSRAIRAARGRIGGNSRCLQDRRDKEPAGHELVRYDRFLLMLPDLIPDSFSRNINPLSPGLSRCGFPTARIRVLGIRPSRSSSARKMPSEVY